MVGLIVRERLLAVALSQAVGFFNSLPAKDFTEKVLSDG
jgi:hypothetical protein